MQSNETALQKFLRRHAASITAADRAIDALAPFATLSGATGYPLISGSRMNVSAFGSLMWDAFQLPVKRCSFLHASVSLDERPWSGDIERFDDLVADEYLERRPPVYGQKAFERAFAASYGDRIEAALDTTLAAGGELARTCRPSQMVCAALRMQTALIAGERDAGGLPALVAHLTQWIPLAADRAKPGRWYVVVGN